MVPGTEKFTEAIRDSYFAGSDRDLEKVGSLSSTYLLVIPVALLTIFTFMRPGFSFSLKC